MNRFWLCALLLVLGSGAVRAQLVLPQEPAQLTERDVVFVMTAAHNSLAQLALGRLLQQNAQTQLLRDYGRTLEEDQLQIYARLVSLAESMGIELVPELEGPQLRQLERLAELSPLFFDQAALQWATSEQELEIARYATAADNLFYPGLADYARDTLLILRQHLARSRALAF